MISDEREKSATNNDYDNAAILTINRQLIPDRSSLRLGTTIESVLHRFQELTPDIHDHCQRVRGYVIRFGKELGLPQADLFTASTDALFHDIGKTADVIVINQPDSLPKEEKEFYENTPHQEVGDTLLHSMQFPDVILQIVRDHHVEHFTKADRLTNIVRIWDRFDAIVDGRYGQPATSPQIALRRIQMQFGIQLDPQFEELFMTIVKRDH